MFFPRLAAAAAISFLATSALHAQCPNGTPPPCDSRQTAELTLIKRAAPRALDDHTYIVLPFSNVTRAPDVEWLSDAAVNMLSMDLARWQDIKVIDDRRVADYLREVPRPAGSRLSMNDAQAVARRAGAGRIVIGDILKVGSRTTVTATLVNARDGSTIRSARGETSVADSLMSVFGKISREILAVTSTDANAGTVGTTSIGAYKEYVAGNQALNRFDAPEAKRRYEAALKLDSNFALAHYKWAMAAGYDQKAAAERAAKLNLSNLGDFARLMEDPDRIAHAKTAARLSTNLPARERSLITGLVAMVSYDYPRACESYRSLVRADSSDVEALYGYGACLAADDMVEPVVPGDTTKMRFRTSWNQAIDAFRQAASVDPTFHLAFDAITNLLTSAGRKGCAHKDVIETCLDTMVTRRYLATLARAGDTLVTEPRAGYRTSLSVIQDEQRLSPLRANVEIASRVSADWTTLAPAEGRAHKQQMILMLRLGRTAEAERELFETLKDPAMRDDPELFLRRAEIAMKLMRGADVIRLIDSTSIVTPSEVGRANRQLYSTVTGRFAGADSFFMQVVKTQRIPPVLTPLVLQSYRIVAGVPSDSLESLEKTIAASLGQPPGKCAIECVSRIGGDFVMALRAPRKWMELPPELGKNLIYAPAYALSRGDTAALRASARSLDSISKLRVGNARDESGITLVAADAYLALGDSAMALALARRMTDTTLQMSSILGSLSTTAAPTVVLWPRAMLLRADLEAAKGDRQVARAYYTSFLALWAKSDPEFAPLMERVRNKLNALR